MLISYKNKFLKSIIQVLPLKKLEKIKQVRKQNKASKKKRNNIRAAINKTESRKTIEKSDTKNWFYE